LKNLPWYQLNIEQVCQDLETSLKNGLTREEAAARLSQYGPNELAQKAGTTVWQMFLEQLKDYMVIILIIASILSMIVGEVADSIVIICIVVVNACLGVYQEYRAGQALEALKKLSAPHAKVVRDGEAALIPAGEVVPGDVVVLETGDYVPADVRLFSTVNLKIEEAALTGESVPVEKDAQAVFGGEMGLGDQINAAFMSTLVTYGRGAAIVTATGMDTVIGKIAEMIQEDSEEDTPLQKKLGHMGKLLGAACIAICAVVFALGLLRGEDILEMFMTSVSLAVAAIPEGLPAVVTIVLALGMQRMVRHNAIMKKLHAVETLGSTTVICSDKTGTLTQNQMTIVKMYVPGTEIDVTGEGYSPAGKIAAGGRELVPGDEPALARLLEIQALCNDARLERRVENGIEEWRVIGDPTEGAMIVAAQKAGLGREELNARRPRLQEIPFDSQRKLMTTFHGDPGGGFLSLTKGAPDILIERCGKIMLRDGTVRDLAPADREGILAENKALACQAFRVLAMAFKSVDKVPEHPTPEDDEQCLVFSGLVGMIDPPRPEAVEAIKVCKKAGIRVCMITGDYKDTAMAIARQLGIIESDDQATDGAELSALDDSELRDLAKRANVYARVSPEHKVRIVQAMKDNGNIVAMTGDGVNDAPALKRADIGVAMGISGTDVTKESADMILTDDNFSSIVSAVEEGRVIYSNIRKFVFFLMSCNIGEIAIIFLAMLLDWPIPLLPIHLLWVNLLTDAFPALALGTEKKEPGLMEMPPRRPDEPIIDKHMITNIIVRSGLLTAVVLFSFYSGWSGLGLLGEEAVDMGRTYAFAAMNMCELVCAYSARSERFNLWRIGVFSNRNMNLATIFSFFLMVLVMVVPQLQDLFRISTLSIWDWDFVVAAAFITLVGNELTKMVKRLVR
jgi:Ca2+-transporting ATPase